VGVRVPYSPDAGRYFGTVADIDQPAGEQQLPPAPEQVTEFVVEAASALGRSTYPVPQSREVLRELATAYGVEADVALFPTFVMAEDRQRGTLIMRHVAHSYRFDQIAESQEVIAEGCAGGLTASEGIARLRAIEDHKALVPSWLRIVGYALSAVGFVLVLQMSMLAVLVGAVLGALVGAALVFLGPNRRWAVLIPVFATFATALLVSLVSVSMGYDVPVRLAAVPVIVLLPGAALTAATVELVNGDMIAGASRLVFAVMQILAMAFGFALAVDVAGLEGQDLTDLTFNRLPPWLGWVGLVVYVVGTMLYFCTPWRLWLASIFVILLTHLVLVMSQWIVSPTLAAGLATAVAAVAAWTINSGIGGGPASLVLFLPAFWSLIPGSSAFVALTGVITKNSELGSIGLNAFLTLVSMSIGIMVASLVFSLQHREIHFKRG